MIAARLEDKETGVASALIVLEPGNIAKLQMGDPIPLSLKNFGLPDVVVLVTYSPDVMWVSEQVAKGKSLTEAIRDSLTRPEVFSRAAGPDQVVKAPDGATLRL